MKNTKRGHTMLFRTDNAKIDISQAEEYVKVRGK